MAKTEIERFAEEELGIKLLPEQMEMIRAAAENKILLYPRRMGLTTANKVVREYLKRGLLAPHTNKAEK